ncbi:PHP domain-containing protein [Siccirubricoccus soli]|uniref:PHP domain-containing protein n=1 Tax=Siccirubricoccus soli TaxID=2899147 RepID=UPI003513B1AA
MNGYAELQVTTNYSFLRGASHPEELFAQAPALGVTDRNSLAGLVRAHRCARETGVRPVVGCHLGLTDGAEILVYPTDRTTYARLCRLLTLGKGRAGKAGAMFLGRPRSAWKGAAGPPGARPAGQGIGGPGRLARLRAGFGDRAYPGALQRAIRCRLGVVEQEGFPPRQAATMGGRMQGVQELRQRIGSQL